MPSRRPIEDRERVKELNAKQKLDFEAFKGNVLAFRTHE